MSERKNILYHSVSCWYELVWEDDRGIVLRIHKDFVAKAIKIHPNAPGVKAYIKKFDFKDYAFEFGKDFGFNKSLVFLGEQDDFLEYSVPTPLVRKKTGKLCRNCKGTGIDEDREETCLYCNGDQDEYAYDYSEAYAVSASLGLLLDLLSLREGETSCDFPQLMEVHTITLADSHGGSLGGVFSKDLVRFLRILPANSEILPIVSVMKSVQEKMEGQLKDFYKHSFRAYLQNNGRIIIDCPGDACGIHPEMDADGENSGYRFSCHNTDTMIQQFVLLSGLAKLQTMARQIVL